MLRFQDIKKTPTPEAATAILDQVKERFGFVPNLITGVARSPELLKSHEGLSAAFEASSLTPEEQQIVLLAASREAECEYCTSVHSLAGAATDLEWDTIERIRDREPLANERHEALRRFVVTIVSSKGDVPHDVWTELEDAGYTVRNLLDVVLGIALKSLTNTVSQLLEVPLDEKLAKRAWSSTPREVSHA